MSWKIFIVALIAAAACLEPVGVCQERPAEVVVLHDVVMKTRDGVSLRADLYEPVGNAALPVLLQRTPYNKANWTSFARVAASRGYLVVIQDVRGRYASDGEWYPFKNEGLDGFDTVEWAAALPRSNGKVGMFGDSYVGATQLLAAVSHPPHLAGICPVVTASNYHENWSYQGGALQQWFVQSWTTSLAQDSISRLIKKQTNAFRNAKTLPLNAYPLFNEPSAQPKYSTEELAPYYLDWLEHPSYDSYWKRWAIDEQYSSIEVPSLTVAAWYDLFLPGSLRNFEGMRAAASAEVRAKQRLIVTIGGHAGWGRKIGSVDFGPDAEFDEGAVTLDWYDYLLKGRGNQFATGKTVRLFVMGKNTWRSEDSWPLKDALERKYYLHSRGRANTSNGDGTLSRVPANVELPDSFTYDSADPVPTTGGPLCCEADHLPPGAQDQRQVEERSDVLVYSTPQLDQDMEVTGPVTLELYASSSAIDTDFTGKLVDVWPNGFAQNLTEGILRARYRDSKSEPHMSTPGQVYRYSIDLASTSNVFLKGHRLRLEVSSSNFPRFDRNHNTGKDPASDSFLSSATNSIFHDDAHPSSLTISVVPR